MPRIWVCIGENEMTAQEFADMMGMSLQSLINAVDPDNVGDRLLANEKARRNGFESFEQMLFVNDSTLLDELQMQSSRGAGRFRILMRLPKNSPMPEDQNLYWSICAILGFGGEKAKALSEHSKYWTIDPVSRIRDWVNFNGGKKPHYNSNGAEGQVYSLLESLSQVIRNSLFVEFPHWTPPTKIESDKKKFLAIQIWGKQHPIQKLNTEVVHEKQLRGWFGNLPLEMRHELYEEFPHWNPRDKLYTLHMKLRAYRDWVISHDGMKPNREHETDKEQRQLGEWFCKISKEIRNKLYDEFSWKPDIQELNYNILLDWASTHKKRPTILSTDTEEKQMYSRLNNLPEILKEKIYIEIPSWLPKTGKNARSHGRDHIELIREWIVKNKRKPKQRNNINEEEKRIANLFYNISCDERKKIVNGFPHLLISAEEKTIELIIDWGFKHQERKPYYLSEEIEEKRIYNRFDALKNKKPVYDIFPHWRSNRKQKLLNNVKQPCK